VLPNVTYHNKIIMSLLLLMYHLGDPGVDGKIILRWIFRKWNVGVWIGSSWFRIGTGGGLLLMR